LLLERDLELSLIGRCLGRAREGQGSALVVEGPAGIGKTVVLTASRDVAESGGFRVLRARGAELEQGFAFGVVRQLVEPVLAAASEGERVSLLHGPPGLAARLLGLPGVDDEVAGAAPAAPDPSFAVLHGLYWLCVNLAADRPVALVVDDAHWADAASLRFLAFLLPRLEEVRVAVLLAARPAEAGPARSLLAGVSLDSAAEVVRLGPLTIGAVARLVKEGLGPEPDPGFAATCRDATGGNPFLVLALVEALRVNRVAPVEGSVESVHDVATATFGPWALLQLGRLGSEAARLARAVAVLERAELSEAAALARMAPGEATRASEALVRAGVLEEQPLAFVRSALRGAVYAGIEPDARAEAHARAARLLIDSPGGMARVAEHLLAASPAGDGWVVEQLAVAGRGAAESGAPESAAAYLRRALAEPPSPDARAGLLLELGLAEFSAGQPGWRRDLHAAVDRAGDDDGRVAAALALAPALGLHERCAEAVRVVDRVAAALDGNKVGTRLVLEAMAVAVGLLDAGTAELVDDRAGALLAAAAQQSVPRAVLAIAAFVATLRNEPADMAAGLVRRAVAATPRRAPEPADPPWLPNATAALLWTERYDEAQALLDAAVARARAQANALLLPRVLSQRSWLALRRGDLTAAEADARALLETPALSAPLLHRLLATGVLVDTLVERGELDEAERALAPVAGDVQTTSLTAAVLRHARGRLRVAQRRFGEGLEDILAAGEITTRLRAPNPSYVPWRSDAALAQLALGEQDAARRLSEEELELARAFGAPRALGVALRAAALVADDRRGEPLLREATEVLDSPDTRLEQARALTDLGALLRRNNHRVSARELLRQALDTTHRAGAAPLADRAETELRATGARPRRVLLTGLEALTASERRIAELAAEGLTNREIAQTLFITARTVEGHLTNVFHKLDISTRTELPTALRRTDTPEPPPPGKLRQPGPGPGAAGEG
jgi:DNA-binding CsgD family transcriptional regulator